MNGSSMNISKTNIELSLGTTESDGFFSFETIELAPGQVIWLQTQEGQDYRIRVGEGLGANNFNAEIRGRRCSRARSQRGHHRAASIRQ
jgi:hypothetical protein